MDSTFEKRHMGDLGHVPPRPSWPLACPVVPVLGDAVEQCRAVPCNTYAYTSRLCAASASCYQHALDARRGHEVRHLGWRFLDATKPTSAMILDLAATVPPLEQPFPMNFTRAFSNVVRGLVTRAAELDGVINPHRAGALYLPILRKRHQALADALHTAGAGEHVKEATSTKLRHQLAVEALIRNCTDFRWLGLTDRGTSPIDAADAERLAALSDIEQADYGVAQLRGLPTDFDAWRLPSIEGWPQHSAFQMGDGK